MKNRPFKRRQDPRIKIEIKVLFKSTKVEKESFLEAKITNFSRSGLFIETSKVYPLNTNVELKAFLPDENKPIKLKGQVSNIAKYSLQTNSGLGIRIHKEKIEESSENKLKEFFELNHIYGWFC